MYLSQGVGGGRTKDGKGVRGLVPFASQKSLHAAKVLFLYTKKEMGLHVAVFRHSFSDTINCCCLVDLWMRKEKKSNRMGFLSFLEFNIHTLENWLS